MRPTIMSVQHEGPEQGYRAVQKGAKLAARLLHTFAPQGPRHMAAADAAGHLMTKLEV
jgi:hypothetical protein